jgi:serine/threonine protein kinase
MVDKAVLHPSDAEFRGTERFKVLGQLGEGGMGVVYSALDRERNSRVALKTLRNLSADGIARLKREFRALQGLHHPNLVVLGELFEEAGRWFFTMELVEGISFHDYVRPRGIRAVDSWRNTCTLPPLGSPQYDEHRLRNAFRQLACGLDALHAGGKIHRDIKPANIRVTREHRVVLLDFGLVTDTPGGSQSTDLHVVGTAAYMAPEQAASKRVGPEADWYSVGVALYEVLVGQLPFDGAPLEILMAKQRTEPPPPRTSVAAVPPDLDALCTDLLRFEPSARPTGREVMQRLGMRSPTRRAISVGSMPTQTPPFVGRQRELEALQEAFEQSRSGAVTVVIEGESGVGKSALVRRFTDSLGEDVVVLGGRCYEREAVPYKAFDGVADALSRYMTRLPKDEAAALLPRMASLLGQVFPAFLKVEAVAQAPRHDVPDPLELRTRLFASVRELLARLADRHSLVIVIDDLQWADADSLSLLAEVLRPPDAPALLCVATTRPGAEREIQGPVRRLRLGGLPPEEASELATLLLARASGPTLVDSTEIAREAAGHPLFIDELVRHAALGRSQVSGSLQLEAALWARISQLESSARRLLDLVAVAGGPVSQDVVAHALESEPALFNRQLSLLRVANLVRTAGARSGDAIEPYHDRVREAVLANLDPERRRVCHERLALALASAGRADPEALAFHWRGAGDGTRAAEFAVLAADQAAAALAFDRAAKLYQVALELRPPSGAEGRSLQTRLGDALANAGRGADAAHAYLAAAPESSFAEALELKRRAAEALLRSGHMDDGLAAVSSVLGAIGLRLPTSPRSALTSLVQQRVALRLRGLRFRVRDGSQVSAEDLTRIDICRSLGFALAAVDNIVGAGFNARGLRLALQAGELQRIVILLSVEATFLAAPGGRKAKRAMKLAQLSIELGRELDDPRARAWARGASGVTQYLFGAWRAADEACCASETMLREQCSGVWWELGSMHTFSLSALTCMGAWGKLASRLPACVKEAQDRGNLYAATNLRVGFPSMLWLAQDDPTSARLDVDDAIAAWARQGVQVQHFYHLTALSNTDLYLGDPAAVRARIDGSWRIFERALLMRIQTIRIHMLHLRARATLGLASRATQSERRRLLRDAERDARLLEKERMPWSDALAALVRATVVALRGESDVAARLLDEAARRFDAVDMALHAATARHRLGRLIGGDEGRALTDAALAWMANQKIKNAPRITAMLVPGFVD